MSEIDINCCSENSFNTMFHESKRVTGSLNIADENTTFAVGWIYNALDVFRVNSGVCMERGHFLYL